MKDFCGKSSLGIESCVQGLWSINCRVSERVLQLVLQLVLQSQLQNYCILRRTLICTSDYS